MVEKTRGEAPTPTQTNEAAGDVCHANLELLGWGCTMQEPDVSTLGLQELGCCVDPMRATVWVLGAALQELGPLRLPASETLPHTQGERVTK